MPLSKIEKEKIPSWWGLFPKTEPNQAKKREGCAFPRPILRGSGAKRNRLSGYSRLRLFRAADYPKLTMPQETCGGEICLSSAPEFHGNPSLVLL
jgi:hypothetical protein